VMSSGWDLLKFFGKIFDCFFTDLNEVFGEGTVDGLEFWGFDGETTIGRDGESTEANDCQEKWEKAGNTMN